MVRELIKELDVCDLCEEPEIEEVEPEPGAEDGTTYYCGNCEEWRHGKPRKQYFKLVKVGSADLADKGDES